jgi:hypothetical protein
MPQGYRQGPGIGPDGRFTYGYTWGEMPISPAVRRQAAGHGVARQTSARRGGGVGKAIRGAISGTFVFAVVLAILGCIGFVIYQIASAQ